MKYINHAILILILIFTVLAPVSLAQTENISIKVVDVTTAHNISKPSELKLQRIIEKSRAFSREAKREALESVSLREDIHVINYTLLDDNELYFYESSANGDETLYIDKLENFNEINSFLHPEIQASATNDGIPDGIGGRATTSGGGSILTTTLRTATENQMLGATSSYAYLYSGFSGKGDNHLGISNANVEADMGLQYSNSLGYVKWNPIFKYWNGQDDEGEFIVDFDDVRYLNGFKPGVDIDFTIYRNLNGATRLSQRGYAWCAERTCKAGRGTYYMTSVLEIQNTNVTSVSKWKFLATLVDPFASGKALAQFKNIKVDNANRNPYQDAVDNATITTSSNNVTISVSK